MTVEENDKEEEDEEGIKEGRKEGRKVKETKRSEGRKMERSRDQYISSCMCRWCQQVSAGVSRYTLTFDHSPDTWDKGVKG